LGIGFAARYVPSNVWIYPDTEVIKEYGGEISLEKFGSVLVAGNNLHPENKIAEQNNMGIPFKKYIHS
jgi:non-heme Fe2+,alpha-ketoglutarate-dependent halogenase